MNQAGSRGPALIIEDEMLVAWATKEIVEGEGFDPVMVVTTDQAAALAADRGDLQLIICDLDLGELSANGLEILERIDPEEGITTVIYTGIDKRLVTEAISAHRSKAHFLSKLSTEEDLRLLLKYFSR